MFLPGRPPLTSPRLPHSDTEESQLKSAARYAHHVLPATIADRVPGGTLGKLDLFHGERLAAALDKSWMVIEAVPEILATKSKVLGQLAKLSPKDAILATNSSSFTGRELLNAIPEASRSQFINTHYYSPPEFNLIEIMANEHTDPAIPEFLVKLARSHGLDPVMVEKESIGFIANRIWASIKREALQITAEGVADHKGVDKALNSFIPGLKPFELMDQTGLNTALHTEEHLQSIYPALGHTYPKALPLLQQKVANNELGWETDKGFYKYTPETQQPHLLYLDIFKGYAVRRPVDGRYTSMMATGLRMPDGVIAGPDGSVFIGCMGATEGGNDGYIVRAYPPADPQAAEDWTVQEIVPQGVSRTPKQICLDEGAEKLYWSDREGGRVWRCNYDGSGIECIYASVPDDTVRPIADQSKHCVGNAVDPKNGWFYWTLKGPARGGQGKILRAPIKGQPGVHPKDRTDIEVLYENLPEPIDLHIGDEGKTIYWTDRGVGAVFKAPLPAELTPSTKPTITVPPKMLSDHFHQTIGLAVDEAAGHIYVTDLGGAVYRINLDGSGKTRIRDTDDNMYTGIALQLPQAAK